MSIEKQYVKKILNESSPKNEYTPFEYETRTYEFTYRARTKILIEKVVEGYSVVRNDKDYAQRWYLNDSVGRDKIYKSWEEAVEAIELDFYRKGHSIIEEETEIVDETKETVDLDEE